MTVADYIQALRKLPQDLEVVIDDNEGDCSEVYEPRLIRGLHRGGSDKFPTFTPCAGKGCGLCARPSFYPMVDVVKI